MAMSCAHDPPLKETTKDLKSPHNTRDKKIYWKIVILFIISILVLSIADIVYYLWQIKHSHLEKATMKLDPVESDAQLALNSKFLYTSYLHSFDVYDGHCRMLYSERTHASSKLVGDIFAKVKKPPVTADAHLSQSQIIFDLQNTNYAQVRLLFWDLHFGGTKGSTLDVDCSATIALTLYRFLPFTFHLSFARSLALGDEPSERRKLTPHSTLRRFIDSVAQTLSDIYLTTSFEILSTSPSQITVAVHKELPPIETALYFRHMKSFIVQIPSLAFSIDTVDGNVTSTLLISNTLIELEILNASALNAKTVLSLNCVPLSSANCSLLTGLNLEKFFNDLRFGRIFLQADSSPDYALGVRGNFLSNFLGQRHRIQVQPALTNHHGTADLSDGANCYLATVDSAMESLMCVEVDKGFLMYLQIADDSGVIATVKSFNSRETFGQLAFDADFEAYFRGGYSVIANLSTSMDFKNASTVFGFYENSRRLLHGNTFTSWSFNNSRSFGDLFMTLNIVDDTATRDELVTEWLFRYGDNKYHMKLLQHVLNPVTFKIAAEGFGRYGGTWSHWFGSIDTFSCNIGGNAVTIVDAFISSEVSSVDASGDIFFALNARAASGSNQISTSNHFLWDSLTFWTEDGSLAVNSSFIYFDGVGLNWNAAGTLDCGANKYAFSIFYNRSNVPKLTCSGNGGYGGNFRNWWMTVEDSVLWINHEIGGHLVSSVSLFLPSHGANGRIYWYSLVRDIQDQNIMLLNTTVGWSSIDGWLLDGRVLVNSMFVVSNFDWNFHQLTQYGGNYFSIEMWNHNKVGTELCYIDGYGQYRGSNWNDWIMILEGSTIRNTLGLHHAAGHITYRIPGPHALIDLSGIIRNEDELDQGLFNGTMTWSSSSSWLVSELRTLASPGGSDRSWKIRETLNYGDHEYNGFMSYFQDDSAVLEGSVEGQYLIDGDNWWVSIDRASYEYRGSSPGSLSGSMKVILASSWEVATFTILSDSWTTDGTNSAHFENNISWNTATKANMQVSVSTKTLRDFTPAFSLYSIVSVNDDKKLATLHVVESLKGAEQLYCNTSFWYSAETATMTGIEVITLWKNSLLLNARFFLKNFVDDIMIPPTLMPSTHLSVAPTVSPTSMFLSPLLRRCEFSADGSQLFVTFSGPTNRGGVINMISCNLIFNFIRSKKIFEFPSSSRCVWTSDNSLQIFSFGSAIDVGDQLSLKEGVFKAKCPLLNQSCSFWHANLPQNMTITPPEYVNPVLVSLILPSEIGRCDDLILDISGSSGSGGRPWKSVSMVVNGSSPNITLLQSFLFSLPSTSVQKSVIVSQQLLNPGFSYTLQVIVCNFLNSCSQVSKSFFVSSAPNIPVIFLQAEGTKRIFRNTTLSVISDSYSTSCQSGKRVQSSSNLLYQWDISPSKALSTSKNPREYRLSPYTLQVRSMYTLHLTVTHIRSLKSSSASVLVYVESGEIVCVLNGGDQHYLRVDGRWILDMSKSYDTNNPIQSPGVDISFQISCIQIAPSNLDNCPVLIFTPLTLTLSQVLVTVNSSFNIVTPTQFRIIMSGRSLLTDDNRRCHRELGLTLVDSVAPVVRMNSFPRMKVNPSSKVKILASIDMKSKGFASWSVDDISLQLSAVSLSPTHVLFSSIRSSTIMNLVIVGDTLSPQSSFTFTLTCSQDNGYSTSASVAVTTNSPPFGGWLQVDPLSGRMLETVFSFVGVGWVDEDLPLSYEFGYLASSTFATNIRSKSPMSHTTSSLPSTSLSLRSSNLTCIVAVFDVMESSSVSLFQVLVEQVTLSLDDLNSYLLSNLNISMSSSNQDVLRNTLGTMNTLLNRVRCTDAPDCALLNRYDCSSFENTCGICVSGYIGLMGHSNTPCILLSSNHRLLSNGDVPCKTDHDCEDLGILMKCSHQSKLCRPIELSCTNNCSGHGQCIFVSKYDPNSTLPECNVLDVDCIPVCKCSSNFLGSSCASPRDEFLNAMALRGSTVESIAVLMSMENVDRNSLQTWMKLLSSAASDYSSLNVASKRLMATLVIEILDLSREFELSFEQISAAGLLDALDVIIPGLSLSFTENSNNTGGDLVLSLLEMHSRFITSDMCDDQNAVSSTSFFFRGLSLSVSNSSALLSIATPKTDFETMTSKFPPQFIELIGVQDSLKVSLFEIEPRPFVPDNLIMQSVASLAHNDSQLSSPLLISLQNYTCVREGCHIKVVLQNLFAPNKLNSLQSAIPRYAEVNCLLNKVENHEYVCPDGATLSIYCNGSFSGVARRYCSLHTSNVTCVTNNPNITCEISPEANSSTTICLCEISKVFVSDRGSVSFSILSVQRSVLQEFATTWQSAASLSASDVRESWVVLLTIGSLVGVSAVLILVGHISDTNIRDKLKHHAKESERSHHKGTRSIQSIEDSLPVIFRTDSLWSKFSHEMQIYHRWFGIIFFYSPTFPRAMRLLSLFSSIIIMLFVQSLTYDIADPDDGTCEDCESERCCLSLKSTLNVNQDRCVWQPDNSTLAIEKTGSCHFRDIREDMIRMFIVALISALASGPISLTIQYLIAHALSKETLNDHDENGRSRERRRNGNANFDSSRNNAILPSGTLVMKSVGTSLHEDLNSLLLELRGSIEGNKNDNGGNYLNELEQAWGSISQTNENNGIVVHSLFAWPIFNKNSHLETTKDLMKELNVVRNETYREYQLIIDMQQESTNESASANFQQRLRLIYLFVKDLARGVSEQVLANKSQRDSDMSVPCKSDRVSWKAKWLGWLVVILLNAGMVFYVYLFSMRQPRSRQSAWFLSFVMWLIFEILVSSTTLVLVFHILIPLYVLTDISKLKEKALGDLLNLRSKYLMMRADRRKSDDVDALGPVKEKREFNAAKYLYTSWRVASLFRGLPESQLILQFSTPWPKRKFGKEESQINQEYEDDVILTASSRILLYFLTSLLDYNHLIQDIVIQTVCNSGLGSVVLLFVRLAAFSPWLSVGCAVAFLICISLLLRLWGGKWNLSGITPGAIYPDMSIPQEDLEAHPVQPQPQPISVPSSSSVDSHMPFAWEEDSDDPDSEFSFQNHLSPPSCGSKDGDGEDPNPFCVVLREPD